MVSTYEQFAGGDWIGWIGLDRLDWMDWIGWIGLDRLDWMDWIG
jgi:hypothetical protein